VAESGTAIAPQPDMHRRNHVRLAAHAVPLRSALHLLVAVWTALALGSAIAPSSGRDAALLGSFGLAAAICVLDRQADAPARARRLPRRLRFIGLALLGVGAAPILGALILAIGEFIGLPARSARHAVPSLIGAFCCLALAPCFEEHLYRARLLPALAPRIGPAAAVLISSAAFALPHLEPWSMRGSAVTGLWLGAWMQWTGRSADCVALHSGMNFSGLAHDGALIAVALQVAPDWSARMIDLMSRCAA
jgi:membrane protease YdiL (CAAX protease family)